MRDVNDSVAAKNRIPLWQMTGHDYTRTGPASEFCIYYLRALRTTNRQDRPFPPLVDEKKKEKKKNGWSKQWRVFVYGATESGRQDITAEMLTMST